MSESAKRDIRGIRYDILDPDFEEMLAKIAHFGAVKYGDFNWHKSRLTGDQGPMNHIRKHYRSYMKGEPYDHPELGTDKRIHLAAIAFNAMMEYWYECNTTPTRLKVGDIVTYFGDHYIILELRSSTAYISSEDNKIKQTVFLKDLYPYKAPIFKIGDTVTHYNYIYKIKELYSSTALLCSEDGVRQSVSLSEICPYKPKT